jgi:DNA-binding transcriptional LysR family regulator
MGSLTRALLHVTLGFRRLRLQECKTWAGYTSAGGDMFRWDDLGVLLAVHRGGSLAAAAAALRVDPSTVSRRVRAFEADLDGRLFDRTPDGLVATDLARRLLPHAEQAEAAAHAAAAEAAGDEIEVAGQVRIALADGFAHYGVAPRIHELLDRYPELRIDFVVGVSLVDLSRREADIAVRFVRPTTGDLVTRRVASSGGYVATVSRAYAERHPDRLHPDRVDWIGWDDSMAHLQEARLYQQVVGRPPRLACSSLPVMVEALRAGAGALLLPAAMLDVEPDAVVIPLPHMPTFEIDVWLVTHRALRHVPRVRAVWDWLEALILAMPGRSASGPASGVDPLRARAPTTPATG